ncbi:MULTISPECIES: 3'-flap repair endonuclease Xpf [Acidianus]|uniref:Multidrug MFS transporter n=1 Tax=Candidatus Acidianus copahuensis TaxID=1160895 RepID=A0A031LP48_9CREN|nr:MULTISPECIES: 3'-flap repair endonuclease Xpf [Acidianus]EZQ03869.1 multidrug MFS transporter [Candidatus Acidianus copahuensis]NON61208.1 multidrug MFS transporter [Acidianus sp. RZ1]
MTVRIYADEREKASEIPDILRELGASVILQQLTVGDYIVGPDVAVERKSVSDLVNSIFDKRFFDQISRLKQTYQKIILLIEGDLSRIKEITSKWKAINSALISISLEPLISIIYSSNRRESAETIYIIAEKSQSERKAIPISLHDKPKFDNIKDIQLYVVESFPHIGGKSAEKLLEKFNTIRNLCNANISDLERVLASRKKAEELYKIINSPFTSQTKDETKSLTDFI